MTPDPRPTDGRPLAASLLVFHGPDGDPVGLGFLVTDELAVTCAHVLRPVLGLPESVDPPAGAAVPVTPAIPTGDAASISATVEHWIPESRGPLGDIAVLRLPAPIPGAVPVWLTAAADAVWEHRARTFGFPTGRPDGVWHVGILRAPQATGWLQFEQAPDAAYEISRGFSGAPVWDDALGAVVGMVVATDTARRAAFLLPVEKLAEASPLLRQVVDRHSPFPGLTAFQDRDAALFFGREVESTAIAELVPQERIVTVFGASGCGKSSLVRAGVVPRLRAAGFDVVVVRAGNVMAELANALTGLSQPELRGEARRAAVVEIRRGLAAHGLEPHVSETTEVRHRRGLVIVVDQLEELLLAEPVTSPESVVGLLLPDPPVPHLHLVTTIRTDFIETLSEHLALRTVARGRTYLLPPMAGEQFRQVVIEPVSATPGAGYEDGLVERILGDLGESPGSLPLLAFTLHRLWQQRQGGRLHHAAYRELGGVRGALAVRAEEARSRCATAGLEEAMWRLLLKLIRLPPGDRVPVRHPVSAAELDPAEWQAANLLSETRLVVVGADSAQPDSVELTHEVLVTAWPALQDRVERDRAFLAWRDQLRQDRERWDRAGRPPDLLPSPTSLEQAEHWRRQHQGEISPADLDFIQHGQRRARGQARRRLSYFVAFSLVLAVASGFGALFVNQSQISTTRAAEAGSRSLAATAADLRDADPALSVMLALGAYRTAPTELARDNLLQTYLAYRQVEWLISDTRTPSESLSASRDGRVILARTRVGRVTLFVRDQAGRAQHVHLPWDPAAGHALDHFVTPDGSRAGYLGATGTLVWFQVGDPGTGLVGEANHIPGLELDTQLSYPDRTMVASADGTRVTAITPSRLTTWDLPENVVEASYENPADLGPVTAIWPGADRDTVLLQHSPLDAQGEVGNARLAVIDLASGEIRGLVENFHRAAVSGNGAVGLTCTSSDRFYRLDIAAGSFEELEFDQTCSRLAADHTGRHLAVSRLGVPAVYELADDGTVTELPRLAPNPVAEHVLSDLHPALLDADGEVYALVHAPTGAALLRQHRAETALSVLRLTPDGTTVVGVTPDGSEIHVQPAEQEPSDDQPGISAKRIGATTTPGLEGLVVDRDGRYVADRVTDHRIEIRSLETLEVASAVEPTPLPEDAPPLTELTFRFTADGTMYTQSGTVVELWDVESGARRAQVDLAGLGILPDVDYQPTQWPGPTVVAHPMPGHVAVADVGTAIRVVDLIAGREVPELRIETGEEVLSASFPPDGSHLVVVRPGGAFWELWRIDPLQRELGPMRSPCYRCTSAAEAVSVTYPGPGRVLIASGRAIHVYEAGQGQPVERYSLGGDAHFHSVSADGHTVLYSPAGGDALVSIIRLDQPDHWVEQLCGLLGWRELTDAEQQILTPELSPTPVCAPPSG